jgi:Flp pilus assembly protein TadD
MRLAILIAVGLLPLALAGCQTPDGAAPEASAVSVPEEFIETNEPARVGEVQFSRGNFALAERYYKAAVERTPGDFDSWVGLAASYDNLKRFDLADRAYTRAMAMKVNVKVLNNRGYSYLLRGDFRNARLMFDRALRIEPDNPIVLHNLELLQSARQKFI